MNQAITRYQALYEAVRARKRKPQVRKGLDAIANRVIVKTGELRNRKSWLLAEAYRVDALNNEFCNLSESALDEEIQVVRSRFIRRARGQNARTEENAAVRRALAITREVARRETGQEAYPVQLMGALGLYHGRIVEMVTGEGKTLTGSIAAPLIAWRRRHVHVLTVNDYLAKRDAESRAPIYNRCLVEVGSIQQEMDPTTRADIYARHIIYGTPKQITADYLRDQLRMGQMNNAWAGRQSAAMDPTGRGGPLIPGLQAAIVDEADAVLIDEGVVPLIIARSRTEDELSEVYRQAARLAEKLDEGPDYSIDRLKKTAELRRRGRVRLEQMFDEVLEGGGDPIWRAMRRAEELVRQALVARHCYKHGQHYHVVDGRVVIVDEYTGRFLADRSWEHGLHQAVEAKEGLDVTADRETLARMSFQRFFRSYPFLCGMTGTAADATSEIEKVYGRPVVVISTNRPLARQTLPMRIFSTEQAKWDAIVQSIDDISAAGQPVLVGTRSISNSELLSARLTERNLPHTTLNALHDAEEADLIAEAGRGPRGAHRPSITVATNMAGRGTDILPDAAAKEAGGVHVLMTEMHTAKRIDRQFIGRSGRQGDPGSSQTFVSLDDELVTQHARGLIEVLRKSSLGSQELRGHPFAARIFKLAQRRAEAHARRNREAVLRQDDWIDKYLPGG
jgi:preprotein translocase subunit SecA